MIVFQSPLTDVAEVPVMNQKSTIGIPSPGGEGLGEGELNCSSGRQPAPIKVGQVHSRAMLPAILSILSHLYVSAPLWQKIRVHSRNSRKASQIIKPVPDPRGGVGLRRAYYVQVLRLHVSAALRYLLPQINPSMTKYRPHTGQKRRTIISPGPRNLDVPIFNLLYPI
jgi:hypothetical protein